MHKILTYLSALLFLTGCHNLNEIPESEVNQEVNKFAKNFIQKLVEGDINYCYNQIGKEYQSEDAKGYLESSYENLKTRNLKKVAILRYNSTSVYGNQPYSQYQLDYEYTYNGLYVYYDFILVKKEGKL